MPWGSLGAAGRAQRVGAPSEMNEGSGGVRVGWESQPGWVPALGAAEHVPVTWGVPWHWDGTS